MPLEAVLFDLDGTLVDSERVNVESVVLAMRKLGTELDAQERHFIVGHSWNEIHAGIVKRHGIDVSMDALIASAVEEKRQLLLANGLAPLPGAVAVVQRLARRVPLAVVSGASRVEVRDAITGLGLLSQFRLFLAAEDYGRGKPHPEPYRSAMEQLGVSPGGCLVLEDSEPGILSGKAAGARVVAVRAGNFLGYDQSAADVVVDTLDEVDDPFVDRLLGA